MHLRSTGRHPLCVQRGLGISSHSALRPRRSGYGPEHDAFVSVAPSTPSGTRFRRGCCAARYSSPCPPTPGLPRGEPTSVERRARSSWRPRRFRAPKARCEHAPRGGQRLAAPATPLLEVTHVVPGAKRRRSLHGGCAPWAAPPCLVRHDGGSSPVCLSRRTKEPLPLLAQRAGEAAASAGAEA